MVLLYETSGFCKGKNDVGSGNYWLMWVPPPLKIICKA